jgi:NADPH:quinone reductase-like Zn-dependent oxidoreductase
VSLKKVTLPKYKDDEIVLKTSCVSIDPTDVKHVDFKMATDGAIVGAECAGHVLLPETMSKTAR